MIKQDYFLRYVEQLAKVLAEIIGLKESGKNIEAIALIDETLNDLKYNSDLENIPNEYYESIADILKVKGEIEKDLTAMAKALALYHQIDELTKSYSIERNKKIEELENQLK